ncbi:hypothetical protein BD309DRAFT_272477 [Dichomitus squalens]|nr:hypothetical protein BD309DRAFT_272477 [Dichomitus squalens]
MTLPYRSHHIQVSISPNGSAWHIGEGREVEIDVTADVMLQPTEIDEADNTSQLPSRSSGGIANPSSPPPSSPSCTLPIPSPPRVITRPRPSCLATPTSRPNGTRCTRSLWKLFTRSM